MSAQIQIMSAESFDDSFAQEGVNDSFSQEDAKARPESKWQQAARCHSDSWVTDRLLSDSNALVQDKLKRLDEQLKCYEGYPACSDVENFLPGCGVSRPKVVFVSLHPSPHDHNGGKAYSGGGWVTTFLSKLSNISLSPNNNCYLMSVFPYYLGKDREPTAEENNIFPRYALERISLLRPQLVVAVGSRAGKYVFVGFDGNKLCNAKRYSDVIQQIKARNAPQKPLAAMGYPQGTNLLACPHPFQLVQFLIDSEGQRTQNNAFSQEAMENFSFCLEILNKIVNRYKVPGPRVFDARTGTYVVDPVPAMRRASASDTTSIKRRKIAEGMKPKPLLRGQSMLDGFMRKAAPLSPAISTKLKEKTDPTKQSQTRKEEDAAERGDVNDNSNSNDNDDEGEGEDEDAGEMLVELREVKGDLFGPPDVIQPSASLGHCVSRDLAMGKGIAVLFKRHFGHVEELLGQRAQIGGVAVLRVPVTAGQGDRKQDQKREEADIDCDCDGDGDGSGIGDSVTHKFVYYMITKEQYWHKPTYDTLRQSLVAVRDHCVANGVRELCLPRIGCGLDGLLWNRARKILLSVFRSCRMRLTIYSL